MFKEKKQESFQLKVAAIYLTNSSIYFSALFPNLLLCIPTAHDYFTFLHFAIKMVPLIQDFFNVLP